MLANLPVEIILLICEYPEFKDLGQLAWTNNRMMQIIMKHLPILLEIVFEGKILFYHVYSNYDKGRIGLFNSSTCSVEEIAKFHDCYLPYQVATTQNKIFGINYESTLYETKQSFEIYDLNTRQVSKGPDPPEWRQRASVAYFKDKLYYLGGWDPNRWEDANRVDVLIDGKWQTGPAFPLQIMSAQTITCDGILYVIIDAWSSNNIYRLSHDEREWIEMGKIPEGRDYFGVASLNGKIYITGGQESGQLFKSCLCFDPSAPVNSRISRITDMNYPRYYHSLVAANGKLYVIGGRFHNSIGEYDPQTNKWREVGKLTYNTA